MRFSDLLSGLDIVPAWPTTKENNLRFVSYQNGLQFVQQLNFQGPIPTDTGMSALDQGLFAGMNEAALIQAERTWAYATASEEE